jgi:hypothetical protein
MRVVRQGAEEAADERTREASEIAEKMRAATIAERRAGNKIRGGATLGKRG